MKKAHRANRENLTRLQRDLIHVESSVSDLEKRLSRITPLSLENVLRDSGSMIEEALGSPGRTSAGSDSPKSAICVSQEELETYTTQMRSSSFDLNSKQDTIRRKKNVKVFTLPR